MTPSVATSVTLRYGNIAVTANANGVEEQFFTVRGYSVDNLSQEAVIDQNTLQKLFPNGENPIGEVILLGSLPV